MRRKIDARQLTASFVNQRTMPTGYQSTLIIVDLHNTHTAAVTVELCLVPSGGTAGTANRILKYSLDVDETRGFVWQQFLGAGDYISMKASTTLKVVSNLSILEEAV